MTNEETVRSETVNEDQEIVEVGMVIGWNRKGQLKCAFDSGVGVIDAPALLEKVQQQIVAKTAYDRQRVPNIVGARSLPPNLNGMPH